MGWDWVKVLKEEMLDLKSDEHLSRHAATDRLAWVSSQAPARAPSRVDDWRDYPPNTPPAGGALLGFDDQTSDGGRAPLSGFNAGPLYGGADDAPRESEDGVGSRRAARPADFPSGRPELPNVTDFDFAMPTAPPLEFPAAQAPGGFASPAPGASLLSNAIPPASPFGAVPQPPFPSALPPVGSPPVGSPPVGSPPVGSPPVGSPSPAPAPGGELPLIQGFRTGGPVAPAPFAQGPPAAPPAVSPSMSAPMNPSPQHPAIPSLNVPGTQGGFGQGGHGDGYEQTYVLTLQIDGVLAGVALPGGGEVTVGRERQSTLVIPEVKQTVSRRAATLVRIGQRAVEARIENRNGAWVTRQLPEGTRQEFIERGKTVTLRIGDRLALDPPGTVVVGLGEPH